MTVVMNSKDEGGRFLLFRWAAERDAIVATVASEIGLPAGVVEAVLDPVFGYLATGEREPMRHAVRKLAAAERDRDRAEGRGPSALHVALTGALRSDLEALPAPVAVGALVHLSHVLHLCVGYYTENTQLLAQNDVERRAAELERALASLSAAQGTLLHQARLTAMGSLADGVAHDVNNALNAVLLRTMLLNRQADPKAKAHLESIESVVRSAAATVQRLQEFARRRESRSRAACDASAVVREAIEMTSQRARLAGDFIEVRLETGGAPAVQADPGELRAILVALVLNAIEALEGSGCIEVFVRPAGDVVEIEVADNGPGIPAEHLHRIFEPFFTTRGPRSSGLGLAMAWGVINRLGGEIRATNRPGGGASVTLSIPCSAATDRPERAAATARSQSVLLVDDDPESRETLQQILVLRGFQVDIAPDGKDALALYRVDLHDAVLCDVSMPVMNGLQLARAIRARNPDAKIALLTGWGSDVADGDRGLVDEVFRKPIEVDAVARFLEKKESGGVAQSARAG